MVQFKTVTLRDKAWVDEIVMAENSPSADYNFGNIYIWDKHYRQLICPLGGRMLTKLRYEGKPTFVFPIGSGLCARPSRRCGNSPPARATLSVCGA